MRLIVAAVLLALLPLPARAQSLAEIAAKEKERRAAAKAAKKSYTDKDLPNSGFSQIGDTPAPSPEPGASPAVKDAKPEKSDEEKKTDQQKAWRERLQKANEDVTRLSAEVDRLQAAADGNSDYFSATRTNLVSQLDQAKAQLAQAKQAVADLEEEGRRNLYR